MAKGKESYFNIYGRQHDQGIRDLKKYQEDFIAQIQHMRYE